MTKVPGEQLTPDVFWAKDEETRANIRRAFKDALIALFKCRIYPDDCALPNVLWDELERKCYIVDFEDYEILERDVDAEAIWSDSHYRYWKMAEEDRPDAE